MSKIAILGFGSLINEESLRATAPTAANLKPTRIKGFVREFSKWDPEGFTETNLDIAGIPHCALNVRPILDKDSQVNGVLFEVDETYFNKLLVREQGYTPVKTTAYDFFSDQELGQCIVFSANISDGQYDFDSKAQRRYLDVCLAGAKTFGQQFYKEFLATTFIDGKSLSQSRDISL